MWGRLKHFLCCSSYLPVEGPHESESERLLGSPVGDGHHPRARAYGAAGEAENAGEDGGTISSYSSSPTTPTLSAANDDASALGSADFRHSCDALVDPKPPQSLADNSSPPFPPPPSPGEFAIASSKNNLGVRCSGKPPASLPNLEIPSFRSPEASARDGRLHTPENGPNTVIDSGIELGVTPKVKGLASASLPFIPEATSQVGDVHDSTLGVHLRDERRDVRPVQQHISNSPDENSNNLAVPTTAPMHFKFSTDGPSQTSGLGAPTSMLTGTVGRVNTPLKDGLEVPFQCADAPQSISSDPELDLPLETFDQLSPNGLGKLRVLEDVPLGAFYDPSTLALPPANLSTCARAFQTTSYATTRPCPVPEAIDSQSLQVAGKPPDSHDNDLSTNLTLANTSLFTYPHAPSNQPPPPGTNVNVAYMAVIQAQRDAIVNPQINVHSGPSAADQGWKVLQEHSAPNAVHTSKALSCVQRCDEGTRVKVLESMHRWAVAKGTDSLSPLLCVTGAAGSGKSAIALTMAEQFSERGILAASFCFSSLDNTRSDCSRLIPTIAHQLGQKSEALRQSISEATHAIGSSIFQASLAEQFFTLVVEPIAKHRDLPVPHILLMDGINEGPQVEEQDQLIEVIANTILKTAFPWRVIIVGRPEVAFRNALEPGGLLHGAYHLRLSDDPDFDAARDIERSLQIHLPKYVKQKASELREVIEAIVTASSGQYIYPATVLKYVSDGRRDSPRGRLETVFSWIRAPRKPTSSACDPLRALDDLYANILNVAIEAYVSTSFEDESKEKVPITLLLQAFASLKISTTCQDPSSEPEYVHGQLLGLAHGHFNSIVCDLRSLVRVREPDEPGMVLQYYHRTFHEFLQDDRRAGKDLYITQGRVGSYLLKRLCDTFIHSADNAAASITVLGGSFYTSETAWANCTVVSILGDLLLKEGSGKDTKRTLKRFENDGGWKKIQRWIELAKGNPQFSEAELVRSALYTWQLPSLVSLRKSKKLELATAAKAIMGMTSRNSG